MFDLESKLLHFLRAYLVDLFLFVVRLDSQSVHLRWRDFTKWLRYVVVFVKILS